MKTETKSNIKAGIWGVLGGAVAAIVLGFAWGGWTTSGGSQKATDEALLASRAAICVAQFMKQPDAQAKLSELKDVASYNRYKTIQDEGWDKMPGQQESVFNVSRACADGLALLMEE